MKFRAFGGLSIATLMLASLTGCGADKPEEQKPPPPKVTVSKPVVEAIVEWDQYTGRLDAIESVDVRARVSGYLQSIHFDEGVTVNKGDLLVIIDPRPFQAELEAANARINEAEAKKAEAEALLREAEANKQQSDASRKLSLQRLDRAKQLQRTNAISDEEVDTRVSEDLQAAADIEGALARIESAKAGIETAKAGIATATSAVDTAKLNLAYTQIRSPITGRISRKNVTDGNLISGGSEMSTLLTTIVSLDPIHCYFDANEQEFLKYTRLSQQGKRSSSRDVKNPVFMALIDEKGYPHEGHMDFVDNRIDPNTGTIRGRAIFSNKDGSLTPGLFASVRLPGSGRYNAVLIPDKCVVSDQSDQIVFVVDGDTVRRQIVELGPISHGLRIVREGLSGEELIVTRGLQRVSAGAKVNAEQEELKIETEQGLPDDYQPVPKEQWLSKPPETVPDDISANQIPYQLSSADPKAVMGGTGKATQDAVPLTQDAVPLTQVDAEMVK